MAKLSTKQTSVPRALLLFALLLTCALQSRAGTDFTYNGLTYTTLTDSTCQTKAGAKVSTGTSTRYSAGNSVTGMLVIPKTVYDSSGKAYVVTSIGDYAFYYCSYLFTVSIPNSITSIGEDAFGGCQGLNSVTIPNSVTSIGSYAFHWCTGLTSVTIGNSVTSIGNGAFYDCPRLTSVTIGNSVTSIGSGAFRFCSSLQKFIVESDNTAFATDGQGALYNKDLSTLLICPGGKTEFDIPNSVISIGDYAFEYCTGLTSVTIPTSVTSIGNDAFYVCSGLTSVTIPNSVTSIGYYAFSGCTGLQYIISLAVTPPTISSITFSDYSVPLIAASKAYKTANYWKNFTHITVAAGADIVSNVLIDNIYYDINGAFAIVVGGEESVTTLTIPSEIAYNGNTYPVRLIEKSAFKDYKSLTSITIPTSITSIGNSAFEGCTGLTSITIPNSVTSIGSYAFEGCTGLTSITIPNSITSIGNSAFEGCTGLTKVCITDLAAWCGISFDYSYSNPLCCAKHLYLNNQEITDLVIPASITSIGNYTFSGCTGLVSVTIPNSVTTIGNGAFSGCTGLTSVVIPNSVKSIRSNVFQACTGLTSVTIPNSVTSIGESAFYGCTGLTSITIPDSVKSIGGSAFEGCTGLVSATIGNSVTSIGDYAFYGCTGLTSVTIPNSVTSIGWFAFSGCSGLTSVTIPNSVTSIGSSAFWSCTGLTSITIGNSVTSIGYSAFGTCTGLTSITIPNSVTSIGNSAFKGCTGLKRAIISATEPTLNGAFYGCTSLEYIAIACSAKSGAFDGCPISVAVDTYSGDNESSYSCKKRRYCYDGSGSQCIKFRSIIKAVDSGSAGKFKLNVDSVISKYMQEDGVTISDIKIDEQKLNFDNDYSVSSKTKLTYYIDGLIVGGDWCVVPEFDNVSIRSTSQVAATVKITFKNRELSEIEKITLNGTEVPKSSSNEYEVTGLKPNTSQYIHIEVQDIYGFTNSTSLQCTTRTISLRIEIKSRGIGITTISLRGVTYHGDATLSEYGFMDSANATEFSGTTEETFTGLDPATSYTFYFGVKVKESTSIFSTSRTCTTESLSLVTSDPVVTSTKSARLIATTNLDTEGNCGFEWRRNDAPDNVSSNRVSCPVVDGYMVGSLRNLKDDVYYKYRPYYTSASGKSYYGSWVGVFTGDADVYFDPDVRTASDVKVAEQSATIKGYVIPGSDDVRSQGFQYRRATTKQAAYSRSDDSSWNSVTASGLKMEVTIDELEAGTTYEYRTYAETDKGTYYGDVQSFTTEGSSGIADVDADAVSDLTIRLVENPTHTPIRLSVSGANKAIVNADLYSVGGAKVYSSEIEADGSVQSVDANIVPGIYLLIVSDGKSRKCERVIVR